MHSVASLHATTSQLPSLQVTSQATPSGHCTMEHGDLLEHSIIHTPLTQRPILHFSSHPDSDASGDATLPSLPSGSGS